MEGLVIDSGKERIARVVNEKVRNFAKKVQEFANLNGSLCRFEGC